MAGNQNINKVDKFLVDKFLVDKFLDPRWPGRDKVSFTIPVDKFLVDKFLVDKFLALANFPRRASRAGSISLRTLPLRPGALRAPVDSLQYFAFAARSTSQNTPARFARRVDALKDFAFVTRSALKIP